MHSAVRENNMALQFTVPGLDEAASEKIISILQNRLSQEQEAALVLKHAHWNVTGPNFIAVHEMIDPEVEAVLAQADETAERIATLGGSPDGRPDAILRNRSWKGIDLTGRHSTESFLKALVEYYDSFIADDRKAIAELDELDVISSNIVQDHVQELEKFQWFMRSHLV
jgi:starvation-inducible DNA-binding protein